MEVNFSINQAKTSASQSQDNKRDDSSLFKRILNPVFHSNKLPSSTFIPPFLIFYQFNVLIIKKIIKSYFFKRIESEIDSWA
jgi:hypothetical protein